MFLPRDLEYIGIFASFAAPIALLGFAIAYTILSLRDSRSEEHDSEIGLKSALYFMFSLSLLLILSGLTIIVIDFLMDNPSTPSGISRPTNEFSPAQRGGFGMMVSGFAVGLFHLVVILGFTNDRRYPATRRVFVGWRLAIHSVVVMVAFTTLVIQVFQKNVSWDQLKPVVSILLVWGPSWLIHLMLMRFYGNTAPAPRLRRAAMDD